MWKSPELVPLHLPGLRGKGVVILGLDPSPVPVASVCLQVFLLFLVHLRNKSRQQGSKPLCSPQGSAAFRATCLDHEERWAKLKNCSQGNFNAVLSTLLYAICLYNDTHFSVEKKLLTESNMCINWLQRIIEHREAICKKLCRGIIYSTNKKISWV